MSQVSVPSTFSQFGNVGEVLLKEPTTARGNCAGCGITLPEGMWRCRYNLCNRCLTPNRFKAEQDEAAKKRSRSFKHKGKHR